jgi:hypothetical protein
MAVRSRSRSRGRSLSPFADAVGWTRLRRSSTSAKELPSFQVELTEELAVSVTAGGKLVPGLRTHGGNGDCVDTALTGCCSFAIRLTGTYIVSAAAED